MQISSSSSSGSSESSVFNAAPFSQARKAFLAVGSALQSGDLTAAKTALTEFQKNAPSRSDANNPVAQKIATLSQALDSGDLSTAKTAFADVTKALAKGPRHHGGGERTEGAAQASAAIAESGASTKAYDVRDTNQDGRVSMKEELAYDATHILESAATATHSTGTAKSGAILNVLA